MNWQIHYYHSLSLKMDAVSSSGFNFPVSVWMKKVSSGDSPRVIVVIEPVERCSAHFTINSEVHKHAVIRF